MGYCYDERNRLVCDGCGNAGRVMKRTCTEIVNGLPYCPAPALCPACYDKHGRAKRIHAACAEPAAAARARYAREVEERVSRFLRGDREVVTRFGDWHPNVPAGWVGLTVRGGNADLHHFLAWWLDDDRVQRAAADGDRTLTWQHDYEGLAPWVGPELEGGVYAPSKEVRLA